MAAAANLVLKDKAAVNVTYYPVKIETGALAKYEDRTQDVLALQPHATLVFSQDGKQRKVQGVVDFLTADPVTGAISKGYGTFEFRLPVEMSLDSRKEVQARLRAFIDDAVVTAAVENGETPW